MADPNLLKKYDKLGPFEIKNELAALALKAGADQKIAYLNAGRGNPNWVATEPREAFFLLGQFAVVECRRVMDMPPGVGGMPRKKISPRTGPCATCTTVMRDRNRSKR
jgi:aspartate 4-decarboxylase